MKSILTSTKIALCAALLWSNSNTAFALPAGFEEEEIFSGVSFPVDFAFTPDEVMVVVQKQGNVTVWQDPDGDYSYKQRKVALDLSDRLCTNGERALGGVQVHPDFGTKNRYIYLYYTFDKNGGCLEDAFHGPVNRLSRFVLSETWTIEKESERVLLETPPLLKRNHNSGKIEFGKDGYIYVSIGDGGADPQAQNISNLFGSIVRVTDNGGIPPDNPFAQDPDAYRCNVNGEVPAGAVNAKCVELYAIGLRNPWRFAMNPNTVGSKVQYYVNDVGANHWEEINDGGDDYQLSGDINGITNYGWPVREGPCRRGLTSYCDDNNGYTHPVHYFMHHETVGAAVTGGAFIPDGIWPKHYDGGYLYAQFVTGVIYLLKDSGEQDCLTACDPVESRMDVSVFTTSEIIPVMQFGPYKEQTMALYYTSIAQGGKMYRTHYAGIDVVKNHPPAAVIDVDTLRVQVGGTVNFNGRASSDPDGNDLLYEWDFNGDGTIDSRLSEDSFSYNVAGIYEARLIVNDGFGGEDRKSVRVIVGSPKKFAAKSGYPGPLFKWNSQTECPSGYDFCGVLEFCQGADKEHYGYRLPCLKGPCECLSISGPLIRLIPGNKYLLTLQNDAQAATNLHTHGLHIVGSGNSDDVTRVVSGGGFCLDYTWDIPWDHPGGTYWYHAHHHGSTEKQVGGGAFGMLIVEDNTELHTLPPWAKNERLLQAAVTERGVQGNGRVNEVILITASQWNRLRVSIVSVEASPLNLTFADESDCKIHKVASDGVWRSEVPGPMAKVYELTGASRADFAIQCGTPESLVPLYYGNELAAIIFVEPAESDDISPYELMETWSPKRPYALRDLSTETILAQNKFEVKLGYENVNGVKWNPDIAIATIGYDQVHEWLLRGTSHHPFHMHLYHVQIATPGGCGVYEEGEFYDVVAAPGNCLVRFRTADVGQRCVIHCHVLFHEDNGSMAWVNVTGVGMPTNDIKSQEYSCPALCQPTAILVQGRRLKTGDFIRSPQSILFLVQYSDGNLKLLRGAPNESGDILWESGITDTPGEFYTRMQADGNLVTRPLSDSGVLPAIWSSRTSEVNSDGLYFLGFNCDGRSMSIYRGTPFSPGDEIWSTAAEP